MIDVLGLRARVGAFELQDVTFTVPAGRHRFVARLRDRAEGDFNYTADKVIELAPGAALVIDFAATKGGFVFRG